MDPNMLAMLLANQQQVSQQQLPRFGFGNAAPSIPLGPNFAPSGGRAMGMGNPSMPAGATAMPGSSNPLSGVNPAALKGLLGLFQNQGQQPITVNPSDFNGAGMGNGIGMFGLQGGGT